MRGASLTFLTQAADTDCDIQQFCKKEEKQSDAAQWIFIFYFFKENIMTDNGIFSVQACHVNILVYCTLRSVAFANYNTKCHFTTEHQPGCVGVAWLWWQWEVTQWETHHCYLPPLGSDLIGQLWCEETGLSWVYFEGSSFVTCNTTHFFWYPIPSKN